MKASILDGKALAQRMQADLQQRVAQLQRHVGRPPGLAVLMVGDHPASAAYVRNKERACQNVGIASFGQHFPADITLETLIQTIQNLNRDPHVDGILVQLPLPDHLDATQALLAIDPDKDADGLHPVNLGRLVRGEPGILSCTPYGVMKILEDAQVDPAGKTAVVVGRSILVGKPIGLMLLAADATVIMAHSRTPDLAAITRMADILVVAVGKPQIIGGDMIKPGATVIDVGINRVLTPEGHGQLVGDVDFASVQEVAGSLTPVPGGVGPMTVTMLLHNTVANFEHRHPQTPLHA